MKYIYTVHPTDLMSQWPANWDDFNLEITPPYTPAQDEVEIYITNT
jgi:hypothetical protein